MKINRSKTLLGGSALFIASMTLHGMASAGSSAPIAGAVPAGVLAPAVRIAPPPPPDPGMSPAMAGLLGLVNAERAARGLAPMTFDARLGAAAQAHSEDQVRRREMSHIGADGSDVASRVDRVGYAWRSVAENVAYGYATSEAVMAGWMASEGHRRNILSANVHIGMGLAVDADGRLYWTLVFATPQ